jgi:hypothetical protein
VGRVAAESRRHARVAFGSGVLRASSPIARSDYGPDHYARLAAGACLLLLLRVPTPMRVFGTPKAAEVETSTSRTYTESSAPKQRIANIPAVIERMTNEIVECVKMKRKPCRIESSTALASERPAWRSIVSVITSAAEKKKLKLSNRKQEFAPTSCTNSPAMLGAMIWDPCYACDINPFTAISPAIGASVRTATDCAGMKKLETTFMVNRMA